MMVPVWRCALLSFDEIQATAAKRKGGVEALRALMPQPVEAHILRQIPNDRFLAAMTRAVFSSGFVWRVVEHKWPGFEEVFYGFSPQQILDLIPPHWEAIRQDERIIRNRPKIETVAVNAQMVMDLSAEYGAMGAMVADWPETDIVGLWLLLKTRGSRLGGNTGPFMLRALGKDTFLLTGDVVTALQRQKLIGKNPFTKQNLKAAQSAFNSWREESGLPLCQISRTLSCTVARDAPGESVVSH